MKQNVIIGFSTLLLFAVIVLIVVDLFKGPSKKLDNPEIYSIENLKKIDSSQICYVESKQIKTTLNSFNGIAVDNIMNKYICGDREVQIYNKNWQKISDFMVDSSVSSIALGINQEIYLGIGNHIEVFDNSGNSIGKWHAYNNRSYLTSIVVIGNDVFAADAENKIILRYDKKGNLLNTIGKKDKDKGIDGFIIPSMYFDVAAGPDDELWAANTGRRELQSFSPKGDPVSFWGKSSMQLEGFAGCCNPVHFAIMPDGYFVTYEKGLNRIKIYNQAGKYICAVTGSPDIDEKSLTTCSVSSPVNDIAVDKEGKIYALDGEQMLIRIFARKKLGGLML